MSANKTIPTGADPYAFVAAIENADRRKDARELLDFFDRITAMKPQMWGDNIVGYGRYHYRYASGREGDYFLTGFSPRKSAMTIYIVPGFKAYEDQLRRLGRHRHSVSCLYIPRLSGLDMTVLGEIVADSVERMKASYEHWPR